MNVGIQIFSAMTGAVLGVLLAPLAFNFLYKLAQTERLRERVKRSHEEFVAQGLEDGGLDILNLTKKDLLAKEEEYFICRLVRFVAAVRRIELKDRTKFREHVVGEKVNLPSAAAKRLDVII